jgi:hypothetical protein
MWGRTVREEKKPPAGLACPWKEEGEEKKKGEERSGPPVSLVFFYICLSYYC